jgi:hypothetical protein
MDGKGLESFADTGVSAECACHDSAARFKIGEEIFTGQFDGQISVRLRKHVLSPERRSTIPLQIIGYTTSSDIRGMGNTTLDFDFSRPITASEISGGESHQFFPATQTMRLHILVTTDAFKGRTLRSMNPGALHNNDVQDFPPPVGSTYSLSVPVLLEDIANPGVPLARLESVNTKITATRISPERLTTNKGFVLLMPSGKPATFHEQRGIMEVAYESAFGGATALTLFDEFERSIGVCFHDHREAGVHAIRIPNTLWQGRAKYYQISIGGLPRTGLMPID